MKKPSYERQNQWVTDYIYPVLGNEGGVKKVLQNYERNNGESLTGTLKRAAKECGKGALKAGKVSEDALIKTYDFLTKPIGHNRAIDRTIDFTKNAVLIGSLVYVISGGGLVGVDSIKEWENKQVEMQYDKERNTLMKKNRGLYADKTLTTEEKIERVGRKRQEMTEQVEKVLVGPLTGIQKGIDAVMADK